MGLPCLYCSAMSGTERLPDYTAGDGCLSCCISSSAKVRFLVQGRTLQVPVGNVLVSLRKRKQGFFAKMPGAQLHTYRHALAAETAWQRNRGNAVQIKWRSIAHPWF